MNIDSLAHLMYALLQSVIVTRNLSTSLRGMLFCVLQEFFSTGAFTVSASTTRTWSVCKKQTRGTRKSDLLEYTDLVPQNYISKVFYCFLTSNTTKPEENSEYQEQFADNIYLLHHQWSMLISFLSNILDNHFKNSLNLFSINHINLETCANLLIQFLQEFSLMISSFI
ncbi:unnamed protein product [Eruca vesicaria subsp. sativa]|uniref:Uncharacterized protein n=1 Tax=Eruca vesicaria subsp. sativa TaxID=29727 RepID=A0ABC8IV27_ERUVS|nr:unnamed protein product [Eruca vesicaria subsp. sativa]